jgi:acyl carrier protein
MDQVTSSIRTFIISNFLFDEAERMSSDTESLLGNGVVDSTGVLDLLLFVEDTFGISVPDDDLTPDNFDSVDNIAAYVRSRTAVAV